jgi:hypothetical protein
MSEKELSMLHSNVRLNPSSVFSRTVRFAFAAVPLLMAGLATAASVSPNTGSLGAPANGTNANGVTFSTGVVGGADQAAVYNNTDGVNTTVPFLSALNPPATSSFSIEFWAKPTASDNDDAPVGNRVSVSPRSGWAFFQRDAAPGWNFRMYNGNGSDRGWDLTGGTATLNAWSHVVATWNGATSTALLYVNGVLADSTNDTPALTQIGVYAPTTTAPLTIGTLDDQTSPYAGSVDEVAWYPSALSATAVQSHFNTMNTTPSAYQALVRSDNASLQLSNTPEPSSALLLAACFFLLRPNRRPAC